MQEKLYETTWHTLPNPFNTMGKKDVITGQISGRSTDIAEIITGGQSAIILTGAPSIGKSALLRYLQRSPEASWSWRNELASTLDPQKTNNIHFIQVDLEGIENLSQLSERFVAQCVAALQTVCKQNEQHFSSDLKGLRELLRCTHNEGVTTEARYFLIFDTIEHIGKLDPQFSNQGGIRPYQERGLVILDQCGAIRTLVDLMDAFSNFGVILSIQSAPRSRMSDQLVHVSADLARFRTMTLQAFTWEDTGKFLTQKPESFGRDWAEKFMSLGGTCIFTDAEQAWLREQAGTHPYLLQQFCFDVFHFKQQFANLHHTWTELRERAKDQLVEQMNEHVSHFLAYTQQRLQEAIGRSSPDTKSILPECISMFSQYQANDVIEASFWDRWGSELRYILYSEGILRYDPFRFIHFPGSILRCYLIQHVEESNQQPDSNTQTGSPMYVREVEILRPGNEPAHLVLSELEYHLIKKLLQKPDNCTQAELMKETWGNRTAFTQRMHHLRKKLKEKCGGVEIIKNQYGGYYSLNHPEWLRLAQ